MKRDKPKNAKISNEETNVPLILDLYCNKKLKVRQISKIVGHAVTRILQDEGVYIYKGNIKSIKKSDRLFIPDSGKKFVAKHKKTGKELGDIYNSAGRLTTYIIKNDGKENIPEGGFFKRKSVISTGKYWYEEFFDIIQVDIIEDLRPKMKCKYCDWKTIDLDNKSGMYTSHLFKKHQKTVDDFVFEFPEYRPMFKTHFDKKIVQDFIKSSPENNIPCAICGVLFRKINEKHTMAAHNMTLPEYKQNYSENTLSDTTRVKYEVLYEKGLKYAKHKKVSAGHQEIANILTEHGLVCDINNRKFLNGLELDIIIPEMKIAIEYNGFPYHTEIYGNKDSSYHLNKTETVEKLGFSLIHIFEDDWIFKKEIIKSEIYRIFNFKDIEIINTNECVLKEISAPIKNVFLEKNNVYGEDSSNIHIGAYFNDELVSVMTFDKRVDKKSNSSYEMKRFSIKNKCEISNIGNEMLKYFVDKYSPSKIISYLDRTLVPIKDNNPYTNLGFIYDSTIKPDYTYFKSNVSRNRRISRFNYSKSKLKERFPNLYSDNKTEWEIMKEAGFDRVWDCGKYKYEINF